MLAHCVYKLIHNVNQARLLLEKNLEHLRKLLNPDSTFLKYLLTVDMIIREQQVWVVIIWEELQNPLLRLSRLDQLQVILELQQFI